MAFKKTVTTPHGLVAVDAYHRVEDVKIEDKNLFSFHLRIYASPDKRFFADRTMTVPCVLDGANPFAQVYEHLKTLPEFEGAVDC